MVSSVAPTASRPIGLDPGSFTADCSTRSSSAFAPRTSERLSDLRRTRRGATSTQTHSASGLPNHLSPSRYTLVTAAARRDHQLLALAPPEPPARPAADLAGRADEGAVWCSGRMCHTPQPSTALPRVAWAARAGDLVSRCAKWTLAHRRVKNDGRDACRRSGGSATDRPTLNGVRRLRLPSSLPQPRAKLIVEYTWNIGRSTTVTKGPQGTLADQPGRA